MKKNYVKPDAEYVAFYSDKDIATVLPLEDYGDDNVIHGSITDVPNPFGNV